ncbi:MAG: NmrA family NAD(P)-binding protein, partial [bacterium]|nr:NmrA family NAD(P)-binding protein [bacterium]
CNSLGDVAAKVAGENPEFHIVNLSSTGAHLAEGVGPIKGLHDIEQKLNAASQRVTHLRPTYFMENLLPSLSTVASDSAIYSTVPAEVAVEQIATRDIGAIAAETLLGDAPDAPRVVHILGPETISFAEVAAVVSGAIGKSVNHVVLGADQLRVPMLAMGMSADTVDQLLELQNAVTQGLVVPPAGSTVRTGGTTFNEFVSEVVVQAYNQAASAAST